MGVSGHASLPRMDVKIHGEIRPGRLLRVDTLLLTGC
jgi:hypothetical protein